MNEHLSSALNSTEKARISAAIDSAEKQTSGELVAVLAESSDDYLYIPLLWAAVIALALPGLWLLLNRGWAPFGIHLYEIQVLSFVALALLFQWMPLKRWLIPKGVKRSRASRLARQEFLTLGLHTTGNRAAIMIFVSLMEHYVEIIADKGIDEAVPTGTWDELVRRFTLEVRAGRFAEGYVSVIEGCGKVLAQYFPPVEGEPDELPNQLIEL